MRVAAGSFSAPNFEKFTQPIGRLRAIRPQQTQAQKRHGFSNGAKHAYATHRYRASLIKNAEK
jgi:hypothetical protein